MRRETAQILLDLRSLFGQRHYEEALAALMKLSAEVSDSEGAQVQQALRMAVESEQQALRGYRRLSSEEEMLVRRGHVQRGAFKTGGDTPDARVRLGVLHLGLHKFSVDDRHLDAAKTHFAAAAERGASLESSFATSVLMDIT